MDNPGVSPARGGEKAELLLGRDNQAHESGGGRAFHNILRLRTAFSQGERRLNHPL